jgi:FkbM family methyltransferase
MARLPFEWLLRARERYSVRLEHNDVPKRVPLLLRASRFRLLPESISSFSPPGRPDLRFVNASSAVVQRTYWFGMDPGGHSSEGAQITLWEELCSQASEIVEVGANIGSLTVAGARATSAPYRAVEPHPETASVLRRNVELNGLRNVEVVEAAAVADDEPDTVELVMPPDDPYSTSTAAAVLPTWGRQGSVAFRVKARPVSELVGDADLVKLDVEGMELPLLLALEAFIRCRRPKMMIEVLDYNTALKRWLSDFAMRESMELQAITAEGPRPLTAAALPATSLLRRYGTRDVLVVPR